MVNVEPLLHVAITGENDSETMNAGLIYVASQISARFSASAYYGGRVPPFPQFYVGPLNL